MLYAIISQDVKNSLQNRLNARPDHLARLEQLQNEGRLIIAGPHPSIDSNDPGEAGFSGSLIVAEFASLGDAENWAEADPYITAGVYQQVIVKPFKKVFPAS
ncbi:MAG: YciI family protein [Gammaproteobacteria bacterium]|nr:YciI family protein [Gammaproteobacteria bacterium]